MMTKIIETGKKKYYVVEFSPKYLKSGYVGFTISGNVKGWSKARALKEAKFHSKYYRNVASGLTVGSTHKFKIKEVI